MKILALEAQNVLGLKAVSLKLDGEHLVVIGGDNAQGKSDVINSFAYALGGNRLCPPVPIRDGQKEAHVTLKLDAYVVTRTWKRRGNGEITTTLKLTGVDGKSTFSRPQELLDKICGPLTFDPSAFARMKPADQVETLRNLLGLDFSTIDADINHLYTERTVTGREHNKLHGALEKMPYHKIEDHTAVSLEDLSAKLEEITKHNAAFDAQKVQLNVAIDKSVNAKRRIDELRHQIQMIEEEIGKLTAEQEKADLAAKESITWLEVNPPIDPAPIRLQISNAKDISQKLIENRERDTVEVECKAAAERYETLTTKIESLRKSKAKQVAEAKYPIENLGMTDAGVIFMGRPLEQASGSEQLNIAMAIGLALAPKKNGLRLLLAKDPAWLDAANLARIRKWAKTEDALIVLERGGHGEECSVIIEAGEVKS